MRYLTITVDVDFSGIKDDYGNELFKDDLNVSDELWNELQDWVAEYIPTIHFDTDKRSDSIGVINDLDSKGIELVKKFQNELGEIKIKYYSEGLLKHIHIE